MVCAYWHNGQLRYRSGNSRGANRRLWRRGWDSNLSRLAGVSAARARRRNPERVRRARTSRRASEKLWRRGWDSNPRMEVLQTSPLDHLGTAPDSIGLSIAKAVRHVRTGARSPRCRLSGLAAPRPPAHREGTSPPLPAASDRYKSPFPTRTRPPWSASELPRCASGSGR